MKDTFCDANLLSVRSITQPLVIAKCAHEHSGCSSSEGNYACAQQSGPSLSKTNLANVTVKRLICQQQRPTINLAPFPGWISLAMLQVDCIRPFSSQNEQYFVPTIKDIYPAHAFAFPACNVSVKTNTNRFTECLIHQHDIPCTLGLQERQEAAKVSTVRVSLRALMGVPIDFNSDRFLSLFVEEALYKLGI